MHVFELGKRIWPDEVNENFAELAANSTRQFGQNDATTDGLSWGYFGGITRAGGAPVIVPNGTVNLEPNATNRVELDPATGAVAAQTSASWNGAKIPLRLITTTDFSIASSLDRRATLVSSVAGAGGGVPAAGGAGSVIVNAPATNSGAAALVSFPLGLGANIGRVQTSAAAWLRIYPTISDRDNDAGRGINDDPATNVTVAFEVVTSAGLLTLNVAPAATLFDPESDGWPARIVNLSGADAAIVVTLTTRPL